MCSLKLMGSGASKGCGRWAYEARFMDPDEGLYFQELQRDPVLIPDDPEDH